MFKGIVSQQCIFYVPPEPKMDADFAWIIVQIHFLLNKFYDISHIMLKLVTFEFSKTSQVPVKRPSRRLRNAELEDGKETNTTQDNLQTEVWHENRTWSTNSQS